MSVAISTHPATLSAKDAAQQLGVSRGLIELWAKEGKLTAFRNPHSRKGVRYDAGQVAAIQTTRAAVQQPKRGKKDYLAYWEAWKKFRFSQSILYSWHDNDCPCLNGAKLEGHREMRPVANGNGLREIWVYNLAQLERIDEVMKREKSGIFEENKATWLSAVAAHRVYNIWDASLGDWQTKVCSFLGRTINYKPMRRLLRSGRYETRIVYLESDLQTIAAAQRAPAESATYQDAEGTWLFAGEVARRTGWPAAGMWYYRQRRWDFLPEGRLRAKKISAEHHPCYPQISFSEVWVYFEKHITRIDTWRRGGEAALAALEEPLASEARHATAEQTQAAATHATPHKRRGRPQGRDPEVVQREQDMLAAWDRNDFQGNKAAAGRAFQFCRQDATDLINDHERGKCKK